MQNQRNDMHYADKDHSVSQTNWLFTLFNEVLRNGHVQIGGEHEFNFRSGVVISDICQGDPCGLMMTCSWILAKNS